MTTTSEHIKDTLLRQRSYAQHFYYGTEARDLLSAHTLEYKGRTFSISVRDDGDFEVNVIGNLMKVIYHAIIECAAPTSATSIDNLVFRSSIVNKADLAPDDAQWAEEAAIFVLSCFQRTCAFVFLSRAADETIDRVSEDLALMVPNTHE